MTFYSYEMSKKKKKRFIIFTIEKRLKMEYLRLIFYCVNCFLRQMSFTWFLRKEIIVVPPWWFLGKDVAVVLPPNSGVVLL